MQDFLLRDSKVQIAGKIKQLFISGAAWELLKIF